MNSLDPFPEVLHVFEGLSYQSPSDGSAFPRDTSHFRVRMQLFSDLVQ